MNITPALLQRLERVEAKSRPTTDTLPVIRIITESDEDQAQQLAALEAAGEYKPGQFVIARRIVDPPAYRRTQS